MTLRPVPIFPSRGVNLFDAPEAIGDDECRKAKNLVPVPLGKLSKRGGLARPFISLGSPLGRPSALVMSPIANSVFDIAVGIVSSSSAESNVVGMTIGSPSGLVWMNLPFRNSRMFMLPWNGKVYVLPGPSAEWAGSSGYPYYTLDAAVATTNASPGTAAFAGTGNELVFPSIAVPYKQRLVLMHFGRGYENTIVFTDNYTATTVGNDILASNTRSINLVAGQDGDEIVAGIEVMLTGVGSPAEAGLLILRKYGNPFLLTGDMDQTTGGTSTLDIKRISINCGCAGPYTVARTPYGIVWAGADDVWAFRDGVVPYQIGTKIQPALRLTPNHLQYRWTGVYHDGFYRLAVWGEGQSLAAASAPGDQWWLDLRDGLPKHWREARWWGPQQFLGGASMANATAPQPATWALVAESRAGRDPKLFYVDYIESNPAGNYQCSIGEYGAGHRDLTQLLASIPDKDYVDPEVEFELVTKEMVLKPPYLQMNDGIAFNAHPTSNIQLNADFVLDDGEYKYTTTKYMTAEGFLTGSGRLGTAKPFKKTQQVGMYPSNRRAATQHRFKLYDANGWSIITGYNDTLVVGVCGYTVSPPTQWFLTVPQGLYSISTLLTAMNAAVLTDASGGTHGTLAANNISLSLVTGLPQFDDSLNRTQSAFSIGFLGDQAAYWAALIATSAQYTVSRRLGTILGFATNTDLNFTGDGASSGAGAAVEMLTAATAPFKKGVARVELYGLQANFEVIPRTP
jgi:hypothetical protein